MKQFPEQEDPFESEPDVRQITHYSVRLMHLCKGYRSLDFGTATPDG